MRVGRSRGAKAKQRTGSFFTPDRRLYVLGNTVLKSRLTSRTSLARWVRPLALALTAWASHCWALDLQRAPDEYVIDHWGFPDGLPQVSVTSIATLCGETPEDASADCTVAVNPGSAT